MTKDIIIRGKTITFTSNGATPIFFKQFYIRINRINKIYYNIKLI